VDSSGIYLSFSTVINDFLAKYNLSGSNLWTLQMPHTSRNEPPRTAYRLAAGNGGVYVAGSVISQSGPDKAFIGQVGSSASLVFLGLNQPWSFLLLGGLIGGSIISLITFRRLRRRERKAA
jgi:hypothetical protein